MIGRGVVLMVTVGICWDVYLSRAVEVELVVIVVVISISITIVNSLSSFTGKGIGGERKEGLGSGHYSNPH